MNWALNTPPDCRSYALSSHQAVNQKEDLNHSGEHPPSTDPPTELGHLQGMSDVAV